MNIIGTAKAYMHSGLSVIPTMADKRPACAWKAFTTRLPSDREIDVNFIRAEGIGIVCGKVSGNLELLDFDDKGSQFEAWFAKVPPYLKARLVVETSPSGGKHVYYRVMDSEVLGNRKLALKPDQHVLIETRGEGGYVKCAPSTGYTLVQGDFCHVPTISPFEQKVLIDYAVALDQRASGTHTSSDRFAAQASPSGDTTPTTGESGVRGAPALPTGQPNVIEDYNARADLPELLMRYGWKRTGGPSDNEHWERPEKNEKSTSATWNGTVFYVFSSNAAPFEMGKGYNKFQVYAALEHGGDMSRAAHALRNAGYGLVNISHGEREEHGEDSTRSTCSTRLNDSEQTEEHPDPGPLPEELLHVPGFVDQLTEHTLAMAPYPNRPLAFAGALTMLAHLTGRNFRDERNLRTNIYLLALADSGVGKDFPRKVNMNLATEVGIMPTMADRFASAEGLEDALLLHPSSFFQVDEVDTLFAALQEKKDSAMEKVYGALLQFATSSDTTYAMRKKAIQQTGAKANKFDMIRARGIREPHLTLFGCAIPKYLYSALSERAMENGLLSRCLIIEAGKRGTAGDPHLQPFSPEILEDARYLVSLGGFAGINLEKLEEAPLDVPDPYVVGETSEATAKRKEVTRCCEQLYELAKENAEKALWTRGPEKTSRLALLYAISENVHEPLITEEAVSWAWRVVENITRRMLYQAGNYVHDNEFDALRQKVLRQLRNYNGEMTHGLLLRNMHVDADTLRKVVETLVQSELITAVPMQKGGLRYTLI